MNTIGMMFDRACSLDGFVESAQRERLATALTALLGGAFVLEDERGVPIVAGRAACGSLPAAAQVEYEFECIGRLSANAPLPTVQGTAALLQILIAAVMRDRMTAELHLHAVQDNYRRLAEQHAALEASQARLRELAEQLDQRVRDQVGVIEQSQRQLFQAEKMASVGQLAAGMAHEINNPIGFIQSNLATARGYASHWRELGGAVQRGDMAAAAAVWQHHDMDFELDDFDALIDESASGAKRIARIVADLKAFSTIDAAAGLDVDLNDMLAVVARLAQTQIGAHATVELAVETLPVIHGDAGRLNQVFLCLLQNAGQAVSAGGTIWLRGRVAGNEVCVEVADNGCGMPPEVMSRVFDPFFTTREVGSGTGLGLTVSRDVVRSHGGRIELDSAPDRGTCVRVWLPAARI